MPKRITQYDARIGTNLLKARKSAGATQENLAKAIGVAFQQVQKYENGTNRISASKLYAASKFLETPIEKFFEGL